MNTNIAATAPRLGFATLALVMAAGFLAAIWGTIGLPQIAVASGFLGSYPTATAAGAVINCLLWLGFAVVLLYGLLAVAGVAHHTWITKRREHLMEIAFGGIGFAVLFLGLAHGTAGVHPGTIQEVIRFSQGR